MQRIGQHMLHLTISFACLAQPPKQVLNILRQFLWSLRPSVCLSEACPKPFQKVVSDNPLLVLGVHLLSKQNALDGSIAHEKSLMGLNELYAGPFGRRPDAMHVEAAAPCGTLRL